MASFINLTPHTIVLRTPAGDREFPASGQQARCAPVSTPLHFLDGVEIVHSTFGELSGIPEPEHGVIYIVSTPCAQKAAQMGRADVVSPDTGPSAIREGGQVKAVLRFQRF